MSAIYLLPEVGINLGFNTHAARVIFSVSDLYHEKAGKNGRTQTNQSDWKYPAKRPTLGPVEVGDHGYYSHQASTTNTNA